MRRVPATQLVLIPVGRRFVRKGDFNTNGPEHTVIYRHLGGGRAEVVEGHGGIPEGYTMGLPLDEQVALCCELEVAMTAA